MKLTEAMTKRIVREVTDVIVRQRRLAAATHESSHAAVACELGIRLANVDVKHFVDRIGICEYEDVDNPLAHALISAAGFVGEHILLGDPHPGGYGPDFDSVASGLVRHYRETGEKVSAAQVFEASARIVAKRATEIRRLADVLLLREAVRGPEATRLLKPVPECFKSLEADLAIYPAETRTLSAVVSTSEVDRDNEVVLSVGCDFTDYQRNPILFYQHDWESLPVGKCVAISASEKGVRAKFTFARRPSTLPLGEPWLPDTLWSLYSEGVMNAFSVGFIPTVKRAATDRDRMIYGRDCESVVSAWRLLEVSCVSLPANASAVTTAVSKGLITRRAAATVLPKPKVEYVRRLLVLA